MRRLRMKVIENMATNAPPAIRTDVVTGLFGSFFGGTGVLVAGWLVGAGTGFVLSSVGGNACVPSGSVGTETAGCVGCVVGVVFSVAGKDSVGCVGTDGSVSVGCVAVGGFVGSEGSVTTGGGVVSVGSVGCVVTAGGVVSVGSGGAGIETVTVQVAVLPPSLERTVITVVPFPFAVTTPVAETVATEKSEEVYVTFLSVALAGLTV